MRPEKGIVERFSERLAQTEPGPMPEMNLEDIMSAYVGKPNACMCGCAGKYYYTTANATLAGSSGTGQGRGYAVGPEEISDAKVLRVYNKMKRSGIEPEIIGNYIYTIDIGSTQYTIYTKKGIFPRVTPPRDEPITLPDKIELSAAEVQENWADRGNKFLPGDMVEVKDKSKHIPAQLKGHRGIVLQFKTYPGSTWGGFSNRYLVKFSNGDAHWLSAMWLNKLGSGDLPSIQIPDSIELSQTDEASNTKFHTGDIVCLINDPIFEFEVTRVWRRRGVEMVEAFSLGDGEDNDLSASDLKFIGEEKPIKIKIPKRIELSKVKRNEPNPVSGEDEEDQEGWDWDQMNKKKKKDKNENK